MSRTPSGRFRADESGVQEVVSFLFSLVMSFLILTMSILAFANLSGSARDLSAHSQLKDVTGRVALAVQQTLLAAAARNETTATANSTTLRYDITLTIPSLIQGWQYSLSLDTNYVNGTIPDRNQKVKLPTFNAAADVPASCNPVQAYKICVLSGSVGGSNGRITVSYLYDANASPQANGISLK